MTANGSAETTEERHCVHPRLGRFVTVSLLENSIQDEKFIRCKSENRVPTVALSKSVAFLDLMRQETRRLILVSMRGETRRHWVLSRGNLPQKDHQATDPTLKMSW